MKRWQRWHPPNVNNKALYVLVRSYSSYTKGKENLFTFAITIFTHDVVENLTTQVFVSKVIAMNGSHNINNNTNRLTVGPVHYISCVHSWWEEKWHALPSIVSCKMRQRERNHIFVSGKSVCVPVSQSLSQSVCVSLSYFHVFEIRCQQQSACIRFQKFVEQRVRFCWRWKMCAHSTNSGAHSCFSPLIIISWVCWRLALVIKINDICNPGCSAVIARCVVTVPHFMPSVVYCIISNAHARARVGLG